MIQFRLPFVTYLVPSHCSQLLLHKPSVRNTRSFSSPVSARFSQDYVVDLVKRGDYENFLATLLLSDPRLKRSALAFRAFNVELSQVLDVTSSPATAQGRFQFWSLVIDEIYSRDFTQVKKQPIVAELFQSIDQVGGKLSKRHFKKLIACRNSPENLSSFPFETTVQLCDYAESSIAPVYYLIIESLIGLRGGKSLESVHLKLDHVASHLSKSQGISNVLRGVVHHAKKGRCYIPSDVLNKHRASHQDFMQCRSKKEVFDVCYDLATIANDHLSKTEVLMRDPSIKGFGAIFLPLVPVSIHLNKLQKFNFDVFNKDLIRRDGNLALKLWLKSIKMKLF